jgi:hypothetical protein
MTNTSNVCSKSVSSLDLQGDDEGTQATYINKLKTNIWTDIIRHTFQETTFIVLQKLVVFKLEALLPASSTNMQFSGRRHLGRNNLVYIRLYGVNLTTCHQELTLKVQYAANERIIQWL